MKKTNKTFKRFAAITSASLLAACAVAPVFTSMTSYAATENTITFTGETVGTHEYTAIKVFSGDANSNALVGDPGTSKAKLENLDWAVDGANATEKQAVVEGFLDDLASSTVLVTDGTADFSADMTAADVAGVLAGYDNTKAKEFAKIVVTHKSIFKTTNSSMATGATSATISVSEDGYYVIEETLLNPNADGDGSYTAYILGVYDADNGADVKVKSSIPKFQKKIKDKNDSTGVVSEWQDSADYDIGDYVPFQLKATLPENYSSYAKYKLVFHDDLNDNKATPAVDVFTMDDTAKSSVVVYVDIDKDGVCDESEKLTGKYSVSYNESTPTDDKENFDCDFEVTIDNLVGAINGIDSTTPVYVEYTAKLNDNAIIGNPGNWNDAYLEYSNNPNVEADGTNESTSETAIDSVVAFTYQVEINKKDGTTGLDLDGADFTLQKFSKGTGEDGADEWKTIAYEEATPGSTFTFEGLDDGEYRLIESGTPENYNPINDMYFTIDATHSSPVAGKAESGILTALTGTNKATSYKVGTGADEKTVESATITLGSMVENDNGVNGGLTANVLNYSGAELPGTGGIGTTIFYLGGGAMAAIGGIYLISKRRMRKSEE